MGKWADNTKRAHDPFFDIPFEVARELKCKPSEAVEVYESIFVYMKRAMSLPNLPDVLIVNWGKYSVGLTDIRGRLRRAINRYRAGQTTKQGLATTFTKLWPAYKILNERHARQVRERRESKATN